MVDFLVRNETFVIIWLGALCTFAIYSVLYRENRFYRFFEHIFIGLATGQGVYIVWTQVLKPQWWDKLLGGQWWWVLAFVIGLMWYFVYSQRYAWISRLIFGFFMGLSAGMIFQSFATVYIPWIYQSFKPLFGRGIPWYTTLNNAIFIGVLLTVMAYFFFSIDHSKKSVRKTASTGRWLLMFAFGAMFGSTVMARMSLFIGRANFLINDWAPTVPPQVWWTLLGLAIIGAFVLIQSRRNRKKLRQEGI